MARKTNKNRHITSEGVDLRDRYSLYLRSVQAPDYDVYFFNKVYKQAFGTKPLILREDFCGTFAVCCEWAKSNPDRIAYGVDLDPEPLRWGYEHNLTKIKPKVRERVHTVEGDVRTAVTPKADVIAAQNFSYFCLRTREELLGYYKAAYKNLKPKGVFILDVFGGAECQEDDREDITKFKDFSYVWEQEFFDPINYFARYHIGFRFKGRKNMERIFSYDWRMWTIPDVRETLLLAGFDRAECYWEKSDKKGRGTGEYVKQDRGDADPAWNAYVIGVKG